MKVAFIHDWLDTYRGGEKVLEAMLELFPNAPIFTMFYDPSRLPDSITGRQIRTPQWLRPFNKVRKAFLPIYPRIVEGYNLYEYDLIISSSSCAAKGVIPPSHAKHLCYLHSPMRYIWDQQQHYFNGPLKWPIINGLANWEARRLRRWDIESAGRVDKFVTNSNFVSERVKNFYKRDSTVVHPPIEQRFFDAPLTEVRGDYFLAAGAFVTYKRFDLAIAACKATGQKLVLAGSGPEYHRLAKLLGPNMCIVHRPDSSKFLELLSKAKALLFPGIEDFGMIPIEAMALGTPVLALGEGGALDYVQPGITGKLIESTEPGEWAEAVNNFNSNEFEPLELRSFAQQFDRPQFLARMREQIHSLT